MISSVDSLIMDHGFPFYGSVIDDDLLVHRSKKYYNFHEFRLHETLLKFGLERNFSI